MKTHHLFLSLLVLAVSGRIALAQPTISITATDATAAETWPGQTPDLGTIRLSRTGNTASPFTVNMRLRGDAVLGVDFTTTPAFGSTLTFPAGQSNIDLTITPIDNLVTQLTRIVRVEVQSPNVAGQYLIAGQGRAEVTIADNDDPNTPLRANVSVMALNATAAEGSNAVTIPGVFRISRDVNTNVSVTVTYSVDGTATPGDDYTALSGSVNIPAGALFADVIVTPVDDAVLETAETVTLTITPSSCPGIFPPPPDCYTIGPSTSATITILDNEIPPPPPVVVLNAAQDTNVFGLPAVVNGSFVASATNGFIASYDVLLDGVVKFSGTNNYANPPAPGTPFQFSFTLSNLTAGYHIVQANLTDDQGFTSSATRPLGIYAIQPPFVPATYEVIAADPEAAETAPGETSNPGKFLVVRRGTPGDLEFFFYTFTGTAKQGIDYTVAYGATTYTTNGWTNVMTQEVFINPIDDAFTEGTETVNLQLCFPILICIYDACAPVGSYCLGGATINLLDNDINASPFSVVSVAATDADAAEISTLSGEPQNPGAFTITRTAPTTNELTVAYSLGGTAKNGVDCETLSGIAVIPTGATSVNVVVNPIFDTLLEGNETVILALRPATSNAPANYVLDPGGNNSASVIIRDYAPTNLPVVRIWTSDSQAIEELTAYSRTASMVVERNTNLAGAITVNYEISGTASNGVDYTTLPGFTTITAGARSATIIINPIADGVAEPVETVGLTLLPSPPETYPPLYLLNATGASGISAGATIRDTALYPGHPYLTKAQRLFQYRHRHFVVPLPYVPVPDPTQPPTAPVTNTTWSVEASTDMVAWAEIGTTQDPEEFVDVNADDFPQRFYRFHEVPPPAP